MSWSISELENTVKITPKVAKELFKLQEDLAVDELWSDVDDVTYDGFLTFNGDHMEHMDFLWDENVQAVLRKNKVKGDICFGSLEGDNSGSFWGYRFDGKGGMKELEGTLNWNEK